MGRPFHPSKLRRQYLNPHTRYDLLKDIRECVQEREITLHDFSLVDAFESLVQEGPELIRAMRRPGTAGESIRDIVEAGGADAVNSGDFANITGQLVFTMIKDRYEHPSHIGDEICDTVKSDFLDGERIPGVGGVGASAIEVVGEGEEFPVLGVNEEYIDAGQMAKRGFIVQVTREMIIKDRTGILLDRCSGGGEYLGINKEFRILSTALGTSNNYNRNGVAYNTYLTSGAYVNRLASNPLTDWTSVEAADLLFDAMTDPNTGVSITLPAAQMIVPSGLKRTAAYVVGATQVQTVDMRPQPGTIRQTYANPMRKGFYGQPMVTIHTNAYVKAITGSSTQWFYGDYKKVHKYRQAWDIETVTAMDNNELMFTRDVWMRWKVSEMGMTQVVEPRYASSHNT